MEAAWCAVRAAASVAVSLLSLAAGFGLSSILRTQASAVSHRLPAAETRWASRTPPLPRMLAQGRLVFLANCAHCHGADASGDEGPDLRGLEVSDRYIANTISRGIKGEMPSFRQKLGAADLAQLSAYVRSLRS